MNNTMTMNKRGQSEVLGFVLIFSIVILSVGLITVSGVGNLQGLQENAQLNNAESAFSVFSDNIEEIYQRDAQTKSTEVRLSETQLQTSNDATRIKVNIDGEGEVQNTTSDSLEYITDGGKISYDTGSIFRQDENQNALMKETPPFIIKEDYVFIHTVTFDGKIAFSGTRNILIETDKSDQSVDYLSSNDGDDIQIELSTSPEKVTAWERYFDQQEETTVVSSNIDNGKLTVDITPNSDATVIVKETVLKIDETS